jgi:hypothetical protein
VGADAQVGRTPAPRDSCPTPLSSGFILQDSPPNSPNMEGLCRERCNAHRDTVIAGQIRLTQPVRTFSGVLDKPPGGQ